MSRFANKNKFSPFYALLQLPGISIQSVHIDSSSVVINAVIKRKNGVCPLCGKRSKRIHSTYYRSLQDVAAWSY
jgi:transposase